jgi:hypothetical protein
MKQHKQSKEVRHIYFQIQAMSEQPAKKIVLNNVLDNLIYLHALLNLLIGNLMKQTYFCHGEIAFPLFCCGVANSRYQNYKRDIKKNAKGTEDKIRLLLSFDHTNTLSSFNLNFYLEKFVQHVKEYKIKMSRHYKKQIPIRQPAAPKFPDIEEEDDNRDDDSVADYSYHNHVDVSPACPHSWSPFKQTALVGSAWPQLSSFQLVESAEADANVMGLIVTVGNGKCVTHNGRGYCNWMRITKSLNSPAHYDKTELTVVPRCPSILQLTYPAVSTALTKDFKFIEAQMEVEIMDSNEQNAGFVSNLQERIIVHETYLAKLELATKTKFIMLLIGPSSGRQYTCHNFDWQGATHADTNIVKVYLHPYKNVIPIKPKEIHEGGGVDEGMTFGYGSCGNCYFYKCWMISVSGQDSEKLAEKSIDKVAIKLKDKANKCAEMFSQMNIG